MKKSLLFICAATLAMSTALPKSKKLPPQELSSDYKQVVQLTDLNPQLTKEVLDGQHPEIAIECREGTELPIKYLGNFGLASVHFAPNLSIKLEKTAYLRFMRAYPHKSKSLKGYISFDLKKWEKLDSKAVHGTAEVNFGISKDKSCVLLETNLIPENENIR
jgi:hypothetical protein